MRLSQEFFKQPEFVQQLEGGGMNRVPAKIPEKISVLLQDGHVHACARQEKSEHHSCRPATDHNAARLRWLYRVQLPSFRFLARLLNFSKVGGTSTSRFPSPFQHFSFCASLGPLLQRLLQLLTFSFQLPLPALSSLSPPAFQLNIQPRPSSKLFKPSFRPRRFVPQGERVLADLKKGEICPAGEGEEKGKRKKKGKCKS
jgi:hypothetical protein